MTGNGFSSDIQPFASDSVVSRSPDGHAMLFESVRDGRGRLFLMTAARTNARGIATARHAEQDVASARHTTAPS